MERVLDFELELNSNSRSTRSLGGPKESTFILFGSIPSPSKTRKTTFVLFPSLGYLEITGYNIYVVFCKDPITIQTKIMFILAMAGLSGSTLITPVKEIHITKLKKTTGCLWFSYKHLESIHIHGQAFAESITHKSDTDASFSCQRDPSSFLYPFIQTKLLFVFFCFVCLFSSKWFFFVIIFRLFATSVKLFLKKQN